MTAYKVFGRCHGVTEEIDEAESGEEAERLANEYRMAFGTSWVIWISGEASNGDVED